MDRTDLSHHLPAPPMYASRRVVSSLSLCAVLLKPRKSGLSSQAPLLRCSRGVRSANGGGAMARQIRGRAGASASDPSVPRPPAPAAPSSSGGVPAKEGGDGDAADEGGPIERAIRSFETRLGSRQDALMEAEVEILNDFAAIVHCLDVAEENAHIACLADWKDWLEREKCSSGQDLVGLLKSADSYLAAKVDSCVLGLGQVHIEGQEGKEALQSGVRLAFLQAYVLELQKRLAAGQLRENLTLEEVSGALGELMACDVKQRLQIQFEFFDRNGDGWLTDEETEMAVEAATNPIQAAIAKTFPAVSGIPKNARGAAGRPMRYVYWDVLQLPVKRRCAFAWAEDRKQTGPESWEITFDQFWKSVEAHFSSVGSVSKDFMAELVSQRRQWHDSKKRRKRATVYGSALLAATIVLDSATGML